MQNVFWLVVNTIFIMLSLGQPNSTSKGVVLTLLTLSTIVNLVALYGQLHTL